MKIAQIAPLAESVPPKLYGQPNASFLISPKNLSPRATT